MRDFTPEEKELIVNTKITLDCFGLCESALKGFELFNNVWLFPFYYWRDLIKHCEYLRVRYKETGDERIFTELVRLLPASYKVVKL